MYAIIENNTVTEYPITNLRVRFPQTSFPETITAASLPPGVVQVHPAPMPPFNAATHKAVQGTPVHDGAKWVTGYTVEPLTAEELQAQAQSLQDNIVAATQDRLDTFARTRNYDGILSLCTYATSAVPKFQGEGQYGVNARDNTWATLYTILAEVQAGTRPVPTGFDDIAGDLPALEWPA
jgi:hypothetical protein